MRALSLYSLRHLGAVAAWPHLSSGRRPWPCQKLASGLRDPCKAALKWTKQRKGGVDPLSEHSKPRPPRPPRPDSPSTILTACRAGSNFEDGPWRDRVPEARSSPPVLLSACAVPPLLRGDANSGRLLAMLSVANYLKHLFCKDTRISKARFHRLQSPPRKPRRGEPPPSDVGPGSATETGSGIVPEPQRLP